MLRQRYSHRKPRVLQVAHRRRLESNRIRHVGDRGDQNDSPAHEILRRRSLSPHLRDVRSASLAIQLDQHGSNRRGELDPIFGIAHRGGDVARVLERFCPCR